MWEILDEDLLYEGRDGILVLSEDVDGLADGMYRTLSDHYLRETLSKSDIERLRRFSPEKIVPEWEQLLMEVGE